MYLQAVTPADTVPAFAGIYALFAPRPPSKEPFKRLTAISSMGISPARVSCRPTAGSTIVTVCAASPCKEQFCIFSWSESLPNLRRGRIFRSSFCSQEGSWRTAVVAWRTGMYLNDCTYEIVMASSARALRSAFVCAGPGEAPRKNALHS